MGNIEEQTNTVNSEHCLRFFASTKMLNSGASILWSWDKLPCLAKVIIYRRSQTHKKYVTWIAHKKENMQHNYVFWYNVSICQQCCMMQAMAIHSALFSVNHKMILWVTLAIRHTLKVEGEVYDVSLSPYLKTLLSKTTFAACLWHPYISMGHKLCKLG